MCSSLLGCKKFDALKKHRVTGGVSSTETRVLRHLKVDMRR